MSRRFSRLFASLATVTTLSLTSLAAHAQGVDEFGGYGQKRGKQSESEQNAAYELRFGRYKPEVDSELNSTPFADYFGEKTRYLIGAEADWQLLRIPHLGSIGPGFGFGITKFTGKSRLAAGGAISNSDTRIWMAPMYLVGVLRADVLMRDFKIPLVPYAKLGLGYGLWWSSDGERTPTVDGKAARGASYGLTYALGGMFLLDFLDPDDAVTADGITGINNSYVFMEWFRPQLDGFGSNKVMNIGSSSWLLGVAVEM